MAKAGLDFPGIAVDLPDFPGEAVEPDAPQTAAPLPNVSRETPLAPVPRRKPEIVPAVEPAPRTRAVPPIPRPQRAPTDQSLARSAARGVIHGAAAGVAGFPEAVGVAAQAGERWALDQYNKIDAGEKPSIGHSAAQMEIVSDYFRADPQARRALRGGIEAKIRPVTEEPAFQLGEKIRSAAERRYPIPPEHQDRMPVQIGKGIGSTAVFLGSGVVGKVLKLPALAVTAGTGAVVNASGTFRDALAKGASFDEAFRASRLSGLVGTSEAVPIAQVLDRFDKGSGGSIRRMIANALKGGVEEGSQELFQNVAENLIASDLVAYDQERGLFQGTGEAGTVGFSVGALFNVLAGALGVRMRGSPDQVTRDFVEHTVREGERGAPAEPVRAVPGQPFERPTPPAPGEPAAPEAPPPAQAPQAPPEATRPDATTSGQPTTILPAPPAQSPLEGKSEPARPVTPPEAVPPTGAPPAPVERPIQGAGPALAAVIPKDIPKTIYRGTGRTDQSTAYTGPAVPILGSGQYFAFFRKHAEEFGPEVTSAPLDVKNPLIIRSGQEWRALTTEAGWRVPNPFGSSEADAQTMTARLQQIARDRGHDSIIVYWDDTLGGDIGRNGENIKLLRNVFGVPQAVFFGEPPRQKTVIGRGSTPSIPVQSTVVTPRGTKVDVRPMILEAEQIVTSNLDDLSPNPAYPKAVQPRERDRAASVQQITRIAADLEPRLLGDTASATDGAPIVGPDMAVESGNARVLAIRRAYDQVPERAEAYRRWLVEQGFDAATDMRRPVLVRQRLTDLTPEQRAAFAREANERTTLGMSAAEQAKADSAAIPDGVLDGYQGGDITAAVNRDFVRRFAKALVSGEDQGQFFTAEGALSQEGRTRIENAMFDRAYGDAALLTDLREDLDTNVKGLGNALIQTAPAWAQLRADAEAGRIPSELDITPALLDAVRLVGQARRSGTTVADLVAQSDMFGPARDPIRDAVLHLFFRDPQMRRARAWSAVADDLGRYAREARKATTGDNLLGLPPVGAVDILRPAQGGLDFPGETVEPQISAPAPQEPAQPLPAPAPEVPPPIRAFQRYTSEQRANRRASFRIGHQSREATGEYFWTHPWIPDRAFPTRKAALDAAKEAGPQKAAAAPQDPASTETATQAPKAPRGDAIEGELPEVAFAAAPGSVERSSLPPSGKLKSAVRVGDSVYVGDSHLGAIAQVPKNQRERAQLDGDNRGYVDHRGKYLDRFEAQRYALKNNLIKHDAPEWAYSSPELIAENLQPLDESEAGNLPEISESRTAANSGRTAPGATYKGLRRPTFDPDVSRREEGPLTRESVLGPLMKAMGVPLYEGRVKGKGTQGFFRKSIEEVRVKRKADIETAAHEIAHLLDSRFPEIRQQWNPVRKANKAVRDELRGISYDKKKLYEGFAEFVRHWMTGSIDPETGKPWVDVKAPAFLKWWEPWVRASRHAEAILEAKAGMHAWFAQSAVDRMASKIGANEGLDAAVEASRAAYARQAYVDDLYAIETAERGATGKIGAATINAHLTRGVAAIVERALERGAPRMIREGGQERVVFIDRDGNPSALLVDARGQPTAKAAAGNSIADNPAYKPWGMKAILEPVSDDLQSFGMYAVARRAQFLAGQGRENLMKPDEIAAGLALETPARRAAFENWQRFNKQVLDFAQKLGTIDPAGRAKWETDVYVPFYRVAQRAVTGRAKLPGLAKVIHRLTGGESNLRNPIENMVQNTRMLIETAMYNHARASLIRELWKAQGGSPETPGAARWLTKIPADTRMQQLTKSQVDALVKEVAADAKLDQITQQMLADAVAGHRGFFSVFMLGQAPQGENVVAFMSGGKPHYFEVADPMLWHSYTRMPRQVRGQALRFLSALRGFGQRTVTVSLDFIEANFFRDQLMAWAMTKFGFRPLIDGAKGMTTRIGSAVGGTKSQAVLDEYLANGGGLAGFFSGDEDYVRHLDTFYKRRGLNPRGIATTYHRFVHMLDTMVDSTEIATRLGEFERGIGKGATTREASYASREVSTDFGRRGDPRLGSVASFVDGLYDTVMFLKAGVEGMDRLYRGVDPLGVGHADASGRARVALIAGSMATASVMLVAWNRAMPDWDDTEEWDRIAHWHVIVPSGPEAWAEALDEIARTGKWAAAGADGRTDPAKFLHLRFPKPWELAAPATISEFAWDGVAEKDPEAALAMLRTVLSAFRFPVAPYVVQPLVELAFNKNLFLDRSIESPAQRALEPYARATPRTSKTVQGLAELTSDMPPELQVSPVQIEHLLRGYFNTWAAYGLMMSDAVFFDNQPELRPDQVPGIRRFTRSHPLFSTKSQEQFYELLREATQARATARKELLRSRPDIATRKYQSEANLSHGLLTGAQRAISSLNAAMERISYLPDLAATRDYATKQMGRDPRFRQRIARLRLSTAWRDVGDVKRALIEYHQQEKNEIYRKAVARAEELPTALSRRATTD